MRHQIELRILGPVELLKGGHLLQLGGARQRTLLAALVLHAGRTLAAERLVDEIWEEDAPETAAKVVQNAVSQLRKLLESDDARSTGSYEVLVTRPFGYELRLDPEQVDAIRFERLVEQGREALRQRDPAAAAAKLREGLELWRGSPLADVGDAAFIAAARARLDELRLAALEDRIEADLATGQSAALIGELEALVAHHPRRERLRL